MPLNLYKKSAELGFAAMYVREDVGGRKEKFLNCNYFVILVYDSILISYFNRRGLDRYKPIKT